MKMRLIDGDRLAELFETAAERGAGVLNTVYKNAAHLARTAQEVKTEPVRHGRWVAIPSAPDTRIAKCSVCGFWQKSNGNDKTGNFLIHNAVYKYCSACGAKMDGDADKNPPDK